MEKKRLIASTIGSGHSSAHLYKNENKHTTVHYSITKRRWHLQNEQLVAIKASALNNPKSA